MTCLPRTRTTSVGDFTRYIGVVMSWFGGNRKRSPAIGTGDRLDWSRTYLCREQRPAEGMLSRPTGRLCPCGFISRREHVSAGFPSGTVAFTEVVVHAGAARGTGSVRGRSSGWARLDVNREDPMELALAADLQQAALDHVAASTCKKYTSQWNLLVAWCNALAEPMVPLPASDGSVALYL